MRGGISPDFFFLFLFVSGHPPQKGPPNLSFVKQTHFIPLQGRMLANEQLKKSKKTIEGSDRMIRPIENESLNPHLWSPSVLGFDPFLILFCLPIHTYVSMWYCMLDNPSNPFSPYGTLCSTTPTHLHPPFPPLNHTLLSSNFVLKKKQKNTNTILFVFNA